MMNVSSSPSHEVTRMAELSTPRVPDGDAAGQDRGDPSAALRLLRALLRRRVGRAFRWALVGRERDPARPEEGRFTPSDADRLLADAWRELDDLAVAAGLDRYPRLGTRLNAYLSLATLAGYRALRRAGVDRERAISVTGDAGWDVYQAMIRIPRAAARMACRRPRGRMSFIIRTLLRFPFAPPADPEAPGYRVRAWSDGAGMHTHWTRCPPLDVFREACGEGELEVFARSWCRFDFAAAEAMVAGGRFRRPLVLSAGDPVCDMTWSVERQGLEGPTSGRPG